MPFDELAERLRRRDPRAVDGPLALYGHCGVGSALAVGVARRLEAAGRELEAVYIGAIFPFARPKGAVWHRCATRARDSCAATGTTRTGSSRMGVDIDDLDPEQADRIISEHARRLPRRRGVLHRPARRRRRRAARADHLGGRLRGPRHRLLRQSATASGSSSPTTPRWWCSTRPGTSSSTTAPTSWPRSSPAPTRALAGDGDRPAAGARRTTPAGGWTARSGTGPPAAPWTSQRPAVTAAQHGAGSWRSPSASWSPSTGSALTAFALPIWIYTEDRLGRRPRPALGARRCCPAC